MAANEAAGSENYGAWERPNQETKQAKIKKKLKTLLKMKKNKSSLQY